MVDPVTLMTAASGTLKADIVSQAVALDSAVPGASAEIGRALNMGEVAVEAVHDNVQSVQRLAQSAGRGVAEELAKGDRADWAGLGERIMDDFQAGEARRGRDGRDLNELLRRAREAAELRRSEGVGRALEAAAGERDPAKVIDLVRPLAERAARDAGGSAEQSFELLRRTGDLIGKAAGGRRVGLEDIAALVSGPNRVSAPPPIVYAAARAAGAGR